MSCQAGISQLALATFNAMDTDKSGKISFAEFKAAMQKEAQSGKVNDANLRAFFDKLDVDKSGDLSLEELKKVFKT
nr:unnamed protein product [Spirometra erinaceieuropaei]